MHRSVMASSLNPDDVLANVGTVVSTTPMGAFVIVQCQADTWDLGLGRLRTGFISLVMHAADEAVIQVPDEPETPNV